ncbi:MAG: zinc metalloprotease HtpX [Desulfohalobiaceae bacterium]
MTGAHRTSRAALRSRKLKNILHSMCIVLALLLLMAALGWMVAGSMGLQWTLFLSVLLLLMSQRISPQLVLRMYQAKALQSAYLRQALQELAKRGELEFVPGLFYVPSQVINAFSVGWGQNSAIAVTDGMLRGLSRRELIAVLAHELSHIRNKDLWVLNLADVFSRVTSSFSFAGLLLLFINLPLLAMEEHSIPWLLILILVFAPSISALLQLALSRSREFDADMDAAVLSGDPQGLAQALIKMEKVQQGIWTRIFFPGYRQRQPSMLRTHPQTQQRVDELMALEQEGLPWPALHEVISSTEVLPRGLAQVLRPPIWRPGRFWF